MQNVAGPISEAMLRALSHDVCAFIKNNYPTGANIPLAAVTSQFQISPDQLNQLLAYDGRQWNPRMYILFGPAFSVHLQDRPSSRRIGNLAG